MAKQQQARIAGVRQKSTRNKPSRLAYTAQHRQLKNKIRKIKRHLKKVRDTDKQAIEALKRLGGH